MKLLIAGAGSPTGKEFVTLLKQCDVPHFVLPERLLTSEDKAGLEQLVKKQLPDQVVNLHTYRAGSQHALERAETDKQECKLIQQRHAGLLAGLCDRFDMPLVHLSTSYVFNGEKKLGYNEQDDVSPVGVYGKTAVQGEKQVASLTRHVILRLGWPFGKNQHDCIRSWIKACKKNPDNLQVNKRRFSPTPNEDVARVLLAVCQQIDCDASVWGTYHYCGLETKKEIEFLQHVLKYASQHDEQIYQLLDNFTVKEAQPVRPEVANTTLSSKKIFDTFGIKQRSWHGSLQATIKTLYQGAMRKSDGREQPGRLSA